MNAAPRAGHDAAHPLPELFWCRIPEEAIEDPDISAEDFRLLCLAILLDKRNRHRSGGVWHTDRQLGARLRGRSRASIQRSWVRLGVRYLARIADAEGPGSGRLVRFLYRLAGEPGREPKEDRPGRLTDETPPVSPVRQVDGQGHPPTTKKTGRPASPLRQGRPRGETGALHAGGALASLVRHLFEQEESERKNQQQGPSSSSCPGAGGTPTTAREGGAEPPAFALFDPVSKPARRFEADHATPAAIRADPELAHRYLLRPEVVEVAERSLVGQSPGSPLWRSYFPGLERHRAAVACLEGARRAAGLDANLPRRPAEEPHP